MFLVLVAIFKPLQNQAQEKRKHQARKHFNSTNTSSHLNAANKARCWLCSHQNTFVQGTFGCSAGSSAVPTFQQFLQAAPHHVDVLYANEFKTNVFIIIFILIALPSSSVGHGIQLANSRSRKEKKITTKSREAVLQVLFFVCLNLPENVLHKDVLPHLPDSSFSCFIKIAAVH